MKIQRFNELIQAYEWDGNEVVIDMGYSQLHDITGIRVEDGKLIIVPDFSASIREKEILKNVQKHPH